MYMHYLTPALSQKIYPIQIFRFFVINYFFEISLIVIYYIHTLCFLNCTYNQFF